MEEKRIQIELTLEELNIIINVLEEVEGTDFLWEKEEKLLKKLKKLLTKNQ